MATSAYKPTSAWKIPGRMNMNSPDLMDMFLPPINRSMRVLDRSFFRKVVPLSAATISNSQSISPARNRLSDSGDLLKIFPISSIRPDDTQPGRKCILLEPKIRPEDRTTWSPTVLELVQEQIAQIRPFDLELTYKDWTMHNILEAVLPELPENETETPAGFACVGHVAHVNLREPYLPLKHLIGQVLIDKNPNITTVINKTEDVGTESVFRTFPYEVLAGPDDMDVTVSESDCTFQFNYAKVYWNSRLETEHKRMVSKFNEGDAVCDVMAGVGPFAVPAGKKKVFVWANDLNPDSYAGLQYAIPKNKVDQFVTASCSDGREFIRRMSKELPMRRRIAKFTKQKLKTLPHSGTKLERRKQELEQTVTLHEPSTFTHYVMNLPASAVEFLDAFWGLYRGRKTEFLPYTMKFMPMVHVFLFTPRRDTAEQEQADVCERVSKHLSYAITPETPDVELFDVRLVSPKKKMYCATFRLPPEVAFAEGAYPSR